MLMSSQLKKMCHCMKTNDVTLTISFSPPLRRVLMERWRSIVSASSANTYHTVTSVICLLMRSVLAEAKRALWMKSQLYAITWRHITQWVSYYSFISDLDFCQGKYHKWAQDANYESRLPGDIKKLLNMQLKHSIMTSGRRNSRSELFHILTRSSIRLRLNG